MASIPLSFPPSTMALAASTGAISASCSIETRQEIGSAGFFVLLWRPVLLELHNHRKVTLLEDFLDLCFLGFSIRHKMTTPTSSEY